VISFLAFRNGQRLGAGGVQEGVLTALLTRVAAKEGRRSEELRFRLSGLETSQPQEAHVDWVDVSDLKPGDEITIRVQEESGDPPTRREPGREHQHAPDGSEQTRCSFCDRFRSQKGCVGGASVVICLGCRVLGAEMLERHAPAVFHLELRTGAACSFCSRPDRATTIVAGKVGMCSDCVAAVPFAS
jgi:hypothetical protein